MRRERVAALLAGTIALCGVARADDVRIDPHAATQTDPRDQPRWLVIDLKLRSRDSGPVEDAASSRDPLPSVSGDEIDERQRFLDRVLASNRRNTRVWHGLFTEVYATGLLVQAGRAAVETNAAERADLAYSAAKAGVGVVGRMLHPPRAVYAPSPDELYPGSSHAARARRLMASEAMLRRDAKDNDHRYLWQGHTINATLNLVGALLVGIGFHDWQRGLASAGIGVAVGELSIWTQPWTAKRGYAAYLRRYRSFF